MTNITLQLPPETEQTLRERARLVGQTLELYLQRLAERDATNGNRRPEGQTFDDILAPVREGFAESGASNEELDALFEEAREEVHQGKKNLGN